MEYRRTWGEVRYMYEIGTPLLCSSHKGALMPASQTISVSSISPADKMSWERDSALAAWIPATLSPQTQSDCWMKILQTPVELRSLGYR